jgi:predicted GNAT family acetyltransferase
MNIEVRLNEAENRYEGWSEGVLAGFAEYQLAKKLIVFTHTEVDPAFEGQGVGSQIAKYALDDVAAKAEYKVMPLCPFIKVYIQKHPEYIKLVYGA